MRMIRSRDSTQRQVLEKRASARAILDRATHAQHEPVVIGEFRADAPVLGAGEPAGQRSEEVQSEGGVGGSKDGAE